MPALSIDIDITGPIAKPNVAFRGPNTDVTGTIDLSSVVGPVDVTMNLLPQGFQFQGLNTSESSMVPPRAHAPSASSQFQNVQVTARALSFEYLNTKGVPYHVYQLVVLDPTGAMRTIDPYIKNG
ncbi:MAG: hypothetical protein ACM3W4_11930 [Ignavibacteriales bacterium]